MDKKNQAAVYRLENAQGHGPFSGDQACVNYLESHFDPCDLVAWIGFPSELLKTLSEAHFVFGWRSQKHYRTFFKPNGKRACRELGFTQVTYRPELRFDFPDGQVLFAKNTDALDLSLIQTLLTVLSKASAPVCLSWLSEDHRAQVRAAGLRQRLGKKN